MRGRKVMIDQEQLVERLKKENEEFRSLLEEHRGLEQKLEKFNKQRFLTPEQEVERKIIRL
jgi:uncharacterized protein YdcH (DUF465 family)